ncbi:MAG: hypothetical protein M5U12_22615 [Verrucomicrobia bacterium]|nr:hypothetical protein [Verrucomicrobiota bacterium]
MRTKGGFANTTGNPVRRLTDPPFINDCLAPGNNPLQPQKGALVASVRPLDRRLHAMGFDRLDQVCLSERFRCSG